MVLSTLNLRWCSIMLPRQSVGKDHPYVHIGSLGEAKDLVDVSKTKFKLDTYIYG